MKRFSRQTDTDSMTIPTRQLRGKRLSAELSLTLTHLSQAPVTNTCYHVNTVSSFIRKHAFAFSDKDRSIHKGILGDGRRAAWLIRFFLFLHTKEHLSAKNFANSA